MNLAFCCILFNTFPCLVPPKVEPEPEVQEDREERTFRNWMNSLGVRPFVTSIYHDLQDALVLFQLYEQVKSWGGFSKPNCWKTARSPFSTLLAPVSRAVAHLARVSLSTKARCKASAKASASNRFTRWNLWSKRERKTMETFSFLALALHVWTGLKRKERDCVQSKLLWPLRTLLIGVVAFPQVQPGIVDWQKVNQPPYKVRSETMKKMENCNYAIELGLQLGFSLVGVGGRDIFDANKKLILALLWQTMRAYTMTILQRCADSSAPIKEEQVTRFAFCGVCVRLCKHGKRFIFLYKINVLLRKLRAI